jgi:hypothetical protein
VVKITGDQSEDIHAMVTNLENNIISGLLLVLAVLMFFLGVRNAGFVATSIPLSMLLSFIVMDLLGISMNMVVLFSLILALGMLVDNAIVVVENIYRYIEEGYDNWRAARLATGEIAMPIVASTFTTLAAFAPLMFWPGIAGEFMGYLPHDAHHHPLQLALRGAHHRAGAVRHVHEAGQRAQPAAPAGGALHAHGHRRAGAPGHRRVQLAQRGCSWSSWHSPSSPSTGRS